MCKEADSASVVQLVEHGASRPGPPRTRGYECMRPRRPEGVHPGPRESRRNRIATRTRMRRIESAMATPQDQPREPGHGEAPVPSSSRIRGPEPGSGTRASTAGVFRRLNGCAARRVAKCARRPASSEKEGGQDFFGGFFWGCARCIGWSGSPSRPPRAVRYSARAGAACTS